MILYHLLCGKLLQSFNSLANMLRKAIQLIFLCREIADQIKLMPCMHSKKKKILVVAMIESIHTARSVELFANGEFDVYVLGATTLEYIHPKLEEMRRSGKIKLIGPWLPRFVKRRRLIKLCISIQALLIRFFKPHFYLRMALRYLKPDLVQSMEMQIGGYPILSLLDVFPKTFTWVITNWGGELYLYTKFPEHRDRMIKLLKTCDAFSCECHRDRDMALELGFRGKMWPVVPITGGMDTTKLRDSSLNQKRHRVTLKGYSGWSGRAIFALKAFELCADELRDKYQITIFSPTLETQIAIRLFEEKTGLKVDMIPNLTAHEKILQILSESVLYIGVGISDGISTACIEAMANGAFPIQSYTSCCTEWFIPNESGFAVDPENISALAEKIVYVLHHPELVEKARQINYEICARKLNSEEIQQSVLQAYRESFDLHTKEHSFHV